MGVLLELQNIRRSYVVDRHQVDILKNITLTIHAGEMLAIVGASGSGKSTLLNILGCLDKPSEGTYRIAGQETTGFNDDELACLRCSYFGFIFQRYHLLPHLDALHNVEIPAIYASAGQVARRVKAQTLLRELGLGARVNYFPQQLSGGQQQRVSIARALMNGGMVILADEPTGALDSRSGAEVMKTLENLRARGHTVVIVTHDRSVARQAQRIVEIHDGEIVRDSGSRHRNACVRAQDPGQPTSGWRQASVRWREACAMAWRAMTANKMRTLLTMLGITIGIASVISILVIGDAAKQQVLTDIRSMGTNTINIYPGRDFGDDDPASRQALKEDDVLVLRQQRYVDGATPSLSATLRLRYGNIDIPATVEGVSPQYFAVMGMMFSAGATFQSWQMRDTFPVVVVDDNTYRRLFPHQPDVRRVIGKTVLIGAIPATIVGVAQDKKTLFGSGKNLRVWLPYSTMNHRLMRQNWLSSISVRLRDGYNSEDAEQRITRLLTLRHGKSDFFTYNMDNVLKTMERTTQTLQLFLSLVAVISLMVGGIGVMNIMLVSVTERTREIGIRRAVGARANDILQQFLVESILVCLAGGVLGVLLSLLIAGITKIALPDWPFTFPVGGIISAFTCATAIGTVFGWLPARSAARLNPVDALTRE